MRRFFLLAMVLFLFVAGDVRAQHVTVDLNKDTDFAKYKTYKWVPIASAQQLDELTSGQLTGTLEVELAKKGLKQTQSDTPDLLIGFQITSPKQTPNYAIGGSYGPTGGGNMGAGVTPPSIRGCWFWTCMMAEANSLSGAAWSPTRSSRTPSLTRNRNT